ncbi:hypothetical protein B0H13DRAFT_2274370 [Mycena leptocephala]|nr:hypothetical protein B0H13DRAFT_2274370 [Mycena leptocephala]
MFLPQSRFLTAEDDLGHTTMLNPYSQGWQNTGQSRANNGGPSIFGALPFTSPDPLPTFFSFRFTSFNPTILNCNVIGPQSRPYFRIMTDTPMPGSPSFRIQMAKTSHWFNGIDILRLNYEISWQDSGSRRMTVNGATFTLTPRDNFIWIYSTGSQPELLGRISRGRNAVTLELTGEAIHLGILEPAVVATFLLQCGRNID